jgi:hypothetical protein
MRGGARVRSGGDGAGAMWQRMRRRGKGGPGVAGDNGGGGCAAKGAVAAVVVHMEAGTRAGGTGEWWGQ